MDDATIGARESAAVGLKQTYAPMGKPRWGRIAEGAGEDPYLGAAMACQPLYQFGYGLSCTTFSISNLRLSSATVSSDGSIPDSG